MKKLIAVLICLVILFAAGSCAFLEGGKPENSSGTGEASSEIGSSEATSSEVNSSEATSSEVTSSEANSSASSGSGGSELEVKSSFSTPDEIGAYIVRCFNEKRFDILAKAFSPSHDIYDYSALASLEGIEASYEVVAEKYYGTVYVTLNVPDPKNQPLFAGENKIEIPYEVDGESLWIRDIYRASAEGFDLEEALGDDYWLFNIFVYSSKLKPFANIDEMDFNAIQLVVSQCISDEKNLEEINAATYEFFGVDDFYRSEDGKIVDRNGNEFFQSAVGGSVMGLGANYYNSETVDGKLYINLIKTDDPLAIFLTECIRYELKLTENGFNIISAKKLSADDPALTVKSFFSTPDEMGAYIVRCFDEKRFDILAKAFDRMNYDSKLIDPDKKADYSELASLEGATLDYTVVKEEGSEPVIRFVLNVPDPKGLPLLTGENVICIQCLDAYIDEYSVRYAIREARTETDFESILDVERFEAGIPRFLLNVNRLGLFESIDDISNGTMSLLVSYNNDSYSTLADYNATVYDYFGVSDYYREQDGKIVDKNGEEYMDMGPSGWHIEAVGVSFYDYTVTGDIVKIRYIGVADELGVFISGGYELELKLTDGGFNFISFKKLPISEFTK